MGLSAFVTSVRATPVCPGSATPAAFEELPSSLHQEYHAGNFWQDIEQIRVTLALYPLSIDGKNFETFDSIFTEDAVLNYTAPLNVMRGLPNIKATIKESLANLTTLHHYGTQVIEALSPNTARAVTYVIANHFAISDLSRVAYAYGQFQDYLVKLPAGDWKICARAMAFNGPIIGDSSILPISLP
ncbi:hypothetical protein NQ176_g1024 [Zarea fungicola]|uniref:Uncharacterized protein n=1 Tax=Zarea fungicola TaxID=93591 RepID=A0ACC1NVU6_9HYPO|nr:hypothetical protein NQ176_g1024 [Lecanicillium fungicola]